MTGDIQLADGTHLMINEVDMKAGQLAEIGLQNVHSIKNLMEWQKVYNGYLWRCQECNLCI